MITKTDLQNLGVEEESQDQIIELLGDAAKKLSSENEGRNAYENVDRAILTLTGVQKSNNQNTTDYLKAAVSGEWLTKQINGKTDELNTKIADLEDKLKNHKGDETLKAEIQALKAEKDKLPDLKNEWVKEYKDKYEAKEKELAAFQRESQLKGLMPKNIRGDLDKEFVDYKMQQVLEKTNVFDKIEKDAEGKTWLIDTVNVEKVLAEDFFKENMESLIDKEQNQSGGGAGKGDSGRRTNGDSTLKIDQNLSKGEQLNLIRDHLVTQKGLDPFDAKFDEEMNKLAIEHKIMPAPQKQE